LGIFHQSWFFQSSLVKSITSRNGRMMASGRAVGKGSKGGGVAGDIGGGDPEEKEGSLMLFKYCTLSLSCPIFLQTVPSELPVLV